VQKLTHNFTIVNTDTDSISFCKQDMSSYSEDEIKSLLNDINSILPEKIKMDDDGYYETVIVIKTKNYVLYDGKKVKIKGSALKASTKEPALKEYINKCIDIILHTRDIEDIKTKMIETYETYVHEIMTLTDIKRWSSRKTISEKTINSTRSNEIKIMNAIKDIEWSEGDRVYVYYDKQEQLKLIQNWVNDHDRVRLLGKLFDTSLVFETILPIKEMFIKYELKKNKHFLLERGYEV